MKVSGGDGIGATCSPRPRVPGPGEAAAAGRPGSGGCASRATGLGRISRAAGGNCSEAPPARVAFIDSVTYVALGSRS
jgi:hypothetical protein